MFSDLFRLKSRGLLKLKPYKTFLYLTFTKKRPFTILKKVVFVLLILMIAVILGGFFYLQNSNTYQTDGERSLHGVKDKIRIVRDEKNMPYIYAQNRHDLLFGQGFAMAQDRLFQMQLTRMFAEGRIAELAQN